MDTCIIEGKMRIEHRGDGVFRYVFWRKADIDLQAAKEITAAGDRLGEQIPHCINIIDAREMLFISSDARKYFAAQKRNHLIGNAIVINSSLQRGLANLYFKFTKQLTPTRLFTDITEAEEWAAQQLENYRADKELAK